MFSNPDKSSFFNKFSIKTRLTILYSVTAFLLLTFIIFLLYWETINILYKADYQFLADEADTIEYLLQNKPFDANALKNAVVDIPTETDSTLYRYYTRLLDENNQIIIETPYMNTILPANKSLNHSTKHLGNRKFYWYNNNNTSYLLVQSPIELRNNKFGLIEIVLDISYQHAVMSDRNIFSLAILFSALCSLAVGIFVANKAIRSLLVLTETTKNISSKSLNQRIDPKSWPKELRELGIAFNQMLDRIEASFTRLKQFSSDLAHELRIPINNLIGQTEIALTHTQSISEYQQILDSNLEEAQRISHLIENMLFLARAENPQLEIQRIKLNVADEIKIICDYYQAMAEEKNIQLTYSGDAEIEGNSNMFRRAISNLLANALKYTPNGGAVHFNTVIESDHTVCITVQDTGLGIADEHLPKIFNRFYRVDAARAHDSGGIGLGLAIVKSIVDLHKGKITVGSELGVGTTIIMHFALATRVSD